MAGVARTVCWPVSQQQQHVWGSGISATSSSSSNSSSSCHTLLRRCPDRLDRFLPFAVALPSLFWTKRSNKGNLVMSNGKFQEFRGRAQAVVGTQVGEATAEGLTQTVADLEVDGHSRSFEGVQTEQELILAISKEVDSGRLPERAGEGMKELYRNYRDADGNLDVVGWSQKDFFMFDDALSKQVVRSGVENAMELSVQVMSTVLDRILLQFENPFTFPNYHPRMLDPYDYYAFGQNYVRPLLDFRNSYLGNVEIFDQIEKSLKEGHNVILLSNHQTEADPAVMALLLEHSHPYLAENLTYVAGDRVVLDPFCKPFSMGRNLLCVYSKKRINDVPELAKMKSRENAKTLLQMSKLLKKGGQLLWVAPSGGRDRPHAETKEWFPAVFEPSSVESMRRLSEVVRVPTDVHALSLICFEIMPPPVQVEKELGERRAVGFSGVGLGVSKRLDINSIPKDDSNPDSVRDAYSLAAWTEVNDMYNVLKAAIYGDQGCAAGTSSVILAQPWRK